MKITNRSIHVTAYADRRQIGSLFDSFQNLKQLKEVAKRKWPNADEISIGDVNNEAYFKEIKL
ncbi:hypothetical protein [Runella zeae]|uniref:hypothetical protein n=1 Tax=Runella zeae TaxID=94255 RepID=UPI0023572BD2|nr:hypothetical protein [Runella zeae]